MLAFIVFLGSGVVSFDTKSELECLNRSLLDGTDICDALGVRVFFLCGGGLVDFSGRCGSLGVFSRGGGLEVLCRGGGARFAGSRQKTGTFVWGMKSTIGTKVPVLDQKPTPLSCHTKTDNYVWGPPTASVGGRMLKVPVLGREPTPLSCHTKNRHLCVGPTIGHEKHF